MLKAERSADGEEIRVLVDTHRVVVIPVPPGICVARGTVRIGADEPGGVVLSLVVPVVSIQVVLLAAHQAHPGVRVDAVGNAVLGVAAADIGLRVAEERDGVVQVSLRLVVGILVGPAGCMGRLSKKSSRAASPLPSKRPGRSLPWSLMSCAMNR